MNLKSVCLAMSAALLQAGGAALADPPPAPAPHHVTHHHSRRHAQAQAAAGPIVPQPQPVAAAPPAVGPAPVPNEAVAAPINDPVPQPSAGPSVFQLHYPPQGDGYVTGSSPQAMDDRNAARATGVEVKVPLPQ